MSKEETSVRLRLTFKRSTLGAATALALAASPAYSLTLGEAEVLSGLNQKFQAEIDLGAITSEELGGLSVRVAPDADYQRANMEVGGVERGFKFEIVGKGDDAAIQITSDRLVSEPLVVFLLEARWQRGRLLREYAIFLDPVDPDEEQQYSDRVTEPEIEAAPYVALEPAVAPSEQPTQAELERQRLRAPVVNPTHADALPELPYHYGPVKKGVSGIEVARELSQGTILTPEQMLMALFEVNPVAFHGNVNGLDAGFMLRIPDAEDIATINSAVAADEISRHNASWKRHVAGGGNNKVVVPPLTVAENQQAQTEKVSASQESDDEQFEEELGGDDSTSENADATASNQGDDTGAESAEKSDESSAEEIDQSAGGDRLELIAPDDSAADSALAETENSSDPEVAAAQAEAAALRVENAKLREQLTETESLLLDIRALLVARSDELSELKTRIARLEGSAVDSSEDNDEIEVVSASVNTNDETSSDGDDMANLGVSSEESSQADQSGSAGRDGSAEKGDGEGLTGQAKPPTPQAPDEANAGGDGGMVSTISKTFDSVVHTVISIGWLVLLPLILLLLIIMLFLLRRRKKEDEDDDVTASSVDEIENESESDGDVDDDDLGSSSDAYSVSGMEVTTGSVEDYNDDFVDELAEAESADEQSDEDAEDEFDDFSDELGEDLDDVILEDEPDDELAEFDEFAIEDDATDDFDVLIPGTDSDDAEIEDDQPEAEEASVEADDEHDDLLSFNESDYQPPAEPEAPVEMEATEDDLDFDLGDFEIAEPEPVADVASEMPAVDVDEDFGLDGDSDEVALAPESEAIEIDDAASLDDIVIGGDDSSSAETLEELDVDTGFDLEIETDEVSADDVAALEESIPAAAPEETAAVADAPPSSDADADIAAFAGGDQANTKLDLAKAYIEMGDTDEARSLLEEVIAEADGQTKAEAEAALAELG